MPPWHVQENKWRAARYGLDAIVVLDADSRSGWSPTTWPTWSSASPCGGPAGLRRRAGPGRRHAGRGASYQRQRAVAERTGGDLVAVVDSVVTELRDGLGQ